jgi:hypothetical protein
LVCIFIPRSSIYTVGNLFSGQTRDYLALFIGQLAASTSSGSASAVGILQAILQAMLQGAGPVGYCLKVLKGIISAGCCARYLVGVLFLDPRSWILWLLLCGRFVPGRFIPGSSFLDIILAACWAFCSWILVTAGTEQRS